MATRRITGDAAGLDDFLHRVLVPVARGILTDDEFEDAWVSLEPDWSDPDTDALWVRVLAGQEVWAQVIWWPGLADDGYAELAARIADGLQDWISETHFGWGQLRTARYELDL